MTGGLNGDAGTGEEPQTFTDTVVDGVAGAEAPAAGGAPAEKAEDVVEAEADGVPVEEASVEGLIADLERVAAERDQYLDTSRRVQAEFENYRKQVAKREADARERANEGMVNEILPVLDAFDGALANGLEDLGPMQATLLDSLAKQGLERIVPSSEHGPAEFDPNLHEAVMHEEGDGSGGPVVAELLRVGYAWKGRVLRPAMVRVRG